MDIKKVVKDNGYTLMQVANALGMSQPDLSQRIKRGSLSVEQCKTIAHAIGVTLDTLVSDGDDDTSVNASSAPALRCPYCGKPISIHLHPAK